MKNLVLINYLKSLFTDYKIKAEFSTNNNDEKVIVVQEQPGNQVVFYSDIDPLFNYFEIVIFGKSIEETYTNAVRLGSFKGKHIIVDYPVNGVNQKWQIIFKQYSNPQPIEYLDIRRVGYSMIYQCIVNRVA